MHRWLIALALSGSTVAAAEPDPEHDAVVAYRAKDYPAFLAAMKLTYAREPSLPAILYNLASAQALTGAPDAAVRTLQQLAATGVGFELEADADFQSLLKRADFRAVVRTMKQNRAPRGKADPAFTVREPDLLTEGIAYDPDTRTFFVSSVRHRKIVAIDANGAQRDFIPEARDGVGCILGITVDRARRVLWASTSAFPQMIGYRPEDNDHAALFAYELATGKLIAKYPVPTDGKPHGLGDVIVARNGDAYTTDSLSSTIYRVSGGKLEVVHDGGFRSLQGLALSADEQTLYFADYGRGVHALDLATRAVTRLEPARGIVATGIDGLYLHRGRLLATQNGIEPRRVIELAFEGKRITAQKVLLSGDPRTHDLTLGVVVGDVLYLNAASGWEHYHEDGTPKPGAAEPHLVLKVPLPR